MLIEILVSILIALLTAFLGFWVGSAKFFNEHKLRMYGEALPALLKFTFNARGYSDEKAFNEALSRIWIYASRKVALKLEIALSYSVHPERGDFMGAMKETILAMRDDVQPWWRFFSRRISKDGLIHFHFKL